MCDIRKLLRLWNNSAKDGLIAIFKCIICLPWKALDCARSVSPFVFNGKVAADAAASLWESPVMVWLIIPDYSIMRNCLQIVHAVGLHGL